MFGMRLQKSARYQEFTEMPEADQLAGIFIPQPEVDGSHAGGEGDRFDGLKQGTGFVALLQVVIGNLGTEVVNVMKSNVS